MESQFYIIFFFYKNEITKMYEAGFIRFFLFLFFKIDLSQILSCSDMDMNNGVIK